LPCTGIRVKTSAVTEAKWDNWIKHDGKVSGSSNPLCGTSTHWSKVRGCKTAALSLTLLRAAVVTRPADITVTKPSQGKCRIPTELSRTHFRNAILSSSLEDVTKRFEGWRRCRVLGR
jgi:hypothetical protein